MNPRNNKNPNKRPGDNVHGFNSMGMVGNLNAMQGLAMDYENMDAHMPSSANQNPANPAPSRARPNANPRPVGVRTRPNPLGPSKPAPARPQAGPVSNIRVAPAKPLPSRPAPAQKTNPLINVNKRSTVPKNLTGGLVLGGTRPNPNIPAPARPPPKNNNLTIGQPTKSVNQFRISPRGSNKFTAHAKSQVGVLSMAQAGMNVGNMAMGYGDLDSKGDPPSHPMPSRATNGNARNTGRPGHNGNKPAAKTPGASSVFGFTELQNKVVSLYFNRQESSASPDEFNLEKIHTNGVKKYLSLQDLKTMLKKGHFSYLRALLNNLSRNEDNFLVLDCNKKIPSNLEVADASLLQNFTDGKFMTDCQTDYKWCEVENFPFQPSLYNNINPNNIIQGSIGDCYLIASLSV
jgi:hypothetical protein